MSEQDGLTAVDVTVQSEEAPAKTPADVVAEAQAESALERLASARQWTVYVGGQPWVIRRPKAIMMIRAQRCVRDMLLRHAKCPKCGHEQAEMLPPVDGEISAINVWHVLASDPAFAAKYPSWQALAEDIDAAEMDYIDGIWEEVVPKTGGQFRQ